MPRIRKPVPRQKLKVRKGDTVVVISGKDRGKTGVIERVLPDVSRVIVEGVNMAKKHQRPTSQRIKGGIIDKAMPIHVSNVALVSPEDGGPTRVGWRVDDDGTKHRVCRRSGRDI